METLNEKLVRIADELTKLNIDVTPEDKTPDDVACVESFCAVFRRVIPDFPQLTFTGDLVRELKKHPNVKATLDFNEASIILSVTGTGNGTIRGHVGVIGTNNEIISNNSRTGKWEYNFTIESWKARYKVKGGMPILLFKLSD